MPYSAAENQMLQQLIEPVLDHLEGRQQHNAHVLAYEEWRKRADIWEKVQADIYNSYQGDEDA